MPIPRAICNAIVVYRAIAFDLLMRVQAKKRDIAGCDRRFFVGDAGYAEDKSYRCAGQGGLAQGGEVLRRMAFVLPAWVFAESDIKNPVQAIFDLPVTARCRGKKGFDAGFSLTVPPPSRQNLLRNLRLAARRIIVTMHPLSLSASRSEAP
jgi:hypothetical protein